MDKHIKLFVFLLMIRNIKSQFIFTNIKGSLVLGNVSSVNEGGSNVLNVVNSHVVDGNGESQSTVILNGGSTTGDGGFTVVNQQTQPGKVNQVNIVNSVQERPQESQGTVVLNSMSTTGVEESPVFNQQTQPEKVNQVNIVSSVQERPEADYNVIRGPVVIHGTGSAVTSIQTGQSAEGHVVSVVSTNVNNEAQSNNIPIDKESNFVVQHLTTQPQILSPTAALNQDENSKQKPNRIQINDKKNPEKYFSSRPVVEDDSKIYFPQD